jgi:hypothetical protein
MVKESPCLGFFFLHKLMTSFFFCSYYKNTETSALACDTMLTCEGIYFIFLSHVGYIFLPSVSHGNLIFVPDKHGIGFLLLEKKVSEATHY